MFFKRPTGVVELVEKKTFGGFIKDIPTKISEKLTGKTPREVFRFVTGSAETDKTKPLSFREFSVETVTVPGKVLSIGSTAAGFGAESLTQKFIPEGITITQQPTNATTTTTSFIVPQFGTVQMDPTTGKRITGETTNIVTTPARGLRKTKIFTPKKVGEGVKFGTELGVFLSAPQFHHNNSQF